MQQKTNHHNYFTMLNMAKQVENASSTVCEWRVFQVSTNDVNKQ